MQNLIENTPLKILLTALAVLTLAPAAHAQITTPPPQIGGVDTKVAFTVTGVVNDGLGTVFICTNKGTSPTKIGVEVFNSAGTSFGVSSIDVASGQTVSLGTKTIIGFVLDSVMPVLGVRQGSARFLTTGKPSALICTALLADPLNDPPTTVTNLQVFKGGKQNGE